MDMLLPLTPMDILAMLPLLMPMVATLMLMAMDTTLARGLLMLSLRLMLLSSMELMDMLDMLLPLTPMDILAMLPLLMPMVPTLMLIAMGTTLARGLLMLSLGRMLLSSMELMDMLDMLLLLTPMDILAMLPLLMPMVPTLMLIAMDATLARGLLMLSLRLMLLSSMELMD